MRPSDLSRAELACRVLPARREQAVDRAERAVMEPLSERRILQPGRGPPRADRHGHRGAGRPELPDQLKLERLERQHTLVTVDDEPGDPELLLPVTPASQRVEH